MNLPKILDTAACLQNRPSEAVRTVLHQGAGLNVVLWQIPPQGSLPPHRHPLGEDVWLVLQGQAQLLDGAPVPRTIRAGQSVAVGAGQVHGARNTGTADCVLVSVVQAQAGFEAV